MSLFASTVAKRKDLAGFPARSDFILTYC